MNSPEVPFVKSPGALGADGRDDFARPQGALRGAPRRQHPGRRAGGRGHVVGAWDDQGTPMERFWLMLMSVILWLIFGDSW